MLEPDRRHLLLDILRPPAGTTLDAAVGTTFSLDLEAVLLAPVAFALFDARVVETGNRNGADPIAVMESVRRHASHIDIFCQAGQIGVPANETPILALVEDSIHPSVAPSRHHIFHPKVWCLRFRQENDDPIYRVIVLSRNLTFDRSWDTVVALDGVVSPDQNPAVNQPLSDFVADLPNLATRPVPADRRDRIEQLARELLAVEWDLPKDFTALSFLPSGIRDHSATRPQRMDRGLLVSPFVTAEQLNQLADACPDLTLVSRSESLDKVALETLDRLTSTYVLSDALDEIAEEESAHSDDTTNEATAEKPGTSLTGLHAKVLVADQGWHAEFRTGSTNATTAGWGGNVEFDIAFSGTKKRTGVDAVLGTSAQTTSLLDIVVPYRRTDPHPAEETAAEKLAVELDQLGREVGRLPLVATIEAQGELFTIHVLSDGKLPEKTGVTITCWPITRNPTAAHTLVPGSPVRLTESALSLRSITSFFAFELTANIGTDTVRTRVVSNATLVGTPADRTERILIEQLQNKTDVLRYLLFLLAGLGDDSAMEFAGALSGRTGERDGPWTPNIPLLESMLRALARDPAALQPVNRLISDLSRTEQGRALLPDGLDQIWPAIWEAKEQLT